MHTLVKAKLYAMLVHGFLTLIVALLTAFLVYRLWYPAPFAQLTGGTDLFLLVLGVEAVLVALTHVEGDAAMTHTWYIESQL